VLINTVVIKGRDWRNIECRLVSLKAAETQVTAGDEWWVRKRLGGRSSAGREREREPATGALFSRCQSNICELRGPLKFKCPLAYLRTKSMAAVISVICWHAVDILEALNQPDCFNFF
jgi:hypothetical protein